VSCVVILGGVLDSKILTPDEKLEQHLRAIAQILIDNAPDKQLSSFEGIETALRDHWLTTLGLAVGSFF